MSLEETKMLIAEQLHTIAESIETLENQPSKIQSKLIINQLYEVMRQISEWSETHGY